MKCRIPPKPMTEEEQAKETKRAIKENSKFMEYADQLLCISLRENFNFGFERFTRFNNESPELGRYYINQYADDDERADDYAKNGYFALCRDLRAYGWEPEEKLWKDSVFDSFKPDKNTASVRKLHAECLEYAKGISFYVREMLCMTALWLCNEYGWREVRLDRAMRPVVEGYIDLMRLYLRCSKEGVAELNKRCKAVKKKYNEMGIFAPVA